MTLKKAMARFDTLYPNELPYEMKLVWISELDGLVYEEIISRHEGGLPTPFTGYIPATPGTTDLLVPFPYDKLYLEHMAAVLELVRGNTERYNNASALAASTFDAFAAEYNRTHTPLQTDAIHF